jgi:hypothetical protein
MSMRPHTTNQTLGYAATTKRKRHIITANHYPLNSLIHSHTGHYYVVLGYVCIIELSFTVIRSFLFIGNSIIIHYPLLLLVQEITICQDHFSFSRFLDFTPHSNTFKNYPWSIPIPLSSMLYRGSTWEFPHIVQVATFLSKAGFLPPDYAI